MSGHKIQWDIEERHELMSQEVRIRDNQMYLPTSLVSAMEEAWNGILTYLKTSTDTKTGEVMIARADPKEPGAVPVRRIGAQNNAVVNFWRPLQKLRLRIPVERQFLVEPITREVDGVGTVFILPMKKRVSVPRNLKEESDEAQETKQGAEGAAETAAAAKAEPAAAPGNEA